MVRYKDAEKAKKAADMGVKYFKDKKIKYRVTPNPKDIDPYTYCSELVWYSYWKAGVSWQQIVISPRGDRTYWITPGAGSLVEPYEFLTNINVSHNGFEIVDNKF